MAQTTYTRFPPLVADEIQVGDGEIAPRYALKLQGSENDHLRAWAKVLSKYTGHDDRLSFASDQGNVAVFLSDGKITTEPWTEGEQESIPSDATAVYFTAVS